MTRFAPTLGVLTLAMSQPTDDADLERGRLAACPKSPNCVSSQADPGDKVHYTEPLSASSDPKAAISALREIIEGLERTKIVTSRDDYLHAEYTTRIFRWVDDVELLADPGAGVVHVRSASRVGYGDLGANRSRVEELRSALASR